MEEGEFEDKQRSSFLIKLTFFLSSKQIDDEANCSTYILISSNY